MADFSAFRSAINGFNRSDVTNYIETLCAEHRDALRSARSEADALRGECESLQKKLDEAVQEKQSLAEQLKVMETLLEEATAPQEADLSEAEPASNDEPADVPPDYPQLELEAYRRAEATERLAAERAARLRTKLSELMELTAGRYEEAGQEIRALTTDLSANLKRLDETLSELDNVFDSAVEGFDALQEDPFAFSV